MDPATVALLVRYAVQYAPDVIKWLTGVLGGGMSTDAAIRSILAARTSDEIEADVIAGKPGSKWHERKKLLDIERAGGVFIYDVIMAQAGLLPGSVSADKMKQADGAKGRLLAAYSAAMKAMVEGNVSAYDEEAAKVLTAAAELLKLKYDVCPLRDRGK